MQSGYIISDSLKGNHTRQDTLMPLDDVIVYSQFKKSATISII